MKKVFETEKIVFENEKYKLSFNISVRTDYSNYCNVESKDKKENFSLSYSTEKVLNEWLKKFDFCL